MGNIINSAPWYVATLFYFGVIAGAVFVAFGLCALMDAFLKWVKHLIYIYKYKHRFNKSPVARCYCKDCDNWNPHSPQATEGRCWKFGYTTADNWFCWDAEPRDMERK